VEVVGDENTALLRRSFKVCLVRTAYCACFQRAYCVDAAGLQQACQGVIDIVVEVEASRHGRLW
jgi:hypothetical protein